MLQIAKEQPGYLSHKLKRPDGLGPTAALEVSHSDLIVVERRYQPFQYCSPGRSRCLHARSFHQVIQQLPDMSLQAQCDSFSCLQLRPAVGVTLAVRLRSPASEIEPFQICHVHAIPAVYNPLQLGRSLLQEHFLYC